jgi:hypothetical protein
MAAPGGPATTAPATIPIAVPFVLLFGLDQSFPSAVEAGNKRAAASTPARSLLLLGETIVSLLAIVYCEGDTTFLSV